MSAGIKSPRCALLNSLLGMVLVLVTGLDIVMLGAVGWATWQRASLSERCFRMDQEDPLQLQGVQREARELRALIAASQESISEALRAFPGDGDLARYLSNLRLEAEAMGLLVTELSPQATQPAAVPVRRFVFRARGSWVSLQRFLAQLAQRPLPTARIEEVSLRQQGALAELSFELVVHVRPPSPLATGNPGDLHAVARLQGFRHQE